MLKETLRHVMQAQLEEISHEPVGIRRNRNITRSLGHSGG
jgi:hypothetical protein